MQTTISSSTIPFSRPRRHVAAGLTAAALSLGTLLAPAAAGAATDETRIAATGDAVIPASTGSDAHDHQVARIFRATLGRNPDAAGLVFWSERLQAGTPAAEIVEGFLGSDEQASITSGDPIVDAYRWALQREPDAEGLAFWSSQPTTAAVLAIADSVEHIDTTGTVEPPLVPDTRNNSVATGVAVIPASTGSDAHDHQVARIFRATLGRNPDAAGLVFWSERLQESDTRPAEIVQGFLDSEEHADRSSGDPIVDAYRWALQREPDTAGYDHWSSQPTTAAVLAIADSAEHIDTTDTVEPPSYRPDVPAHWVDAGHGVWVPPILLEIRWCESNHDYTAANPRSSARGAYQFLTISWNAYGHAARYGVPYAHLATPAQQDEAALITWQVSGTRPWLASRSCWG